MGSLKIYKKTTTKHLRVSSSLNNLDQHHDNGDDQQSMNDATHRVAGQQSHPSQNQKNYIYCPEHNRFERPVQASH